MDQAKETSDSNFIKILFCYKYPRYIYLQATLLLHSAVLFLTESTFLPKERVLHFLTKIRTIFLPKLDFFLKNLTNFVGGAVV